MRALRGRLVGALVGVVIAAALGPAAASAAAEVLFEQPVGPSAIGVPSNEDRDTPARSTEAIDDFIVPTGTRWRLELGYFFGAPATPTQRPFGIQIWGGVPGLPAVRASDPLFETGLWNEEGPDAMFSLSGAPLLEPGHYWIGVQQIDGEGRGDWSWLTGPDTAGTMPASVLGAEGRPAGAEPGQAFKLSGVAVQRLTVDAEGYGTIASIPPGIFCSTICSGDFARGASVTLTEDSFPGLEFKEWQWNAPHQNAPSCLANNGCEFVLDEDTTVTAKSTYVNKVNVIRVVRDHRTGRGELLVSLPNEGVVSLSGRGLRPVSRTMAPEGSIGLPLVPRGELAIDCSVRDPRRPRWRSASGPPRPLTRRRSNAS